MADFRTRLTLDGSDFSQSLNDAGKSVEDFKKSTSDASKSVDDMGKSSKRTASELLKEMKNMEGLGRSTSNYRQQLSQMTRQIQDLTLNYSHMSDEMKNSDFGREVASQIDELKSKAAEYKDTLMDVQTSITKLSSDTSNLDALKMGFEGVGAAMSLVASAGILGADSQEKLIKVMARLQAIQAATNSVIQIANVLNKDSIFMLKMKELWTKLNTKAQITNTTAIKGATVAQKAFNTAAKKNVYVILATVIIAVVAALVKYSKQAKESRERQEELNKKIEEAKEKFEDYKSAMVSSIGPVIGKFRELQTQWETLRTETEKTEWLDKNKKAFEDLGLSVQTVNDAEEVLVTNASSVIQALTARAKAAASYSMITAKSNDVIAAQLDKEKALLDARNKIHVGARIFTTGGIPDFLEEAGLADEDMTYEWAGGQSGAGYYIITERAAQKYYNYVSKKQDEIIEQKEREVEIAEQLAKENEAVAQDAASRVKQMENNNNGGGTGGSSGSGRSYGNIDKPSFEEGSLAWYDSQIQALQNLINNEKLSQEELEEINEKIKELENSKLNYIQSLRGGKLELIPTLKPISTQEAVEKMDPIVIPAKITLLEGVDGMISGINSINSGLQGMYKTWRDIGDTISNCEDPIESMFTVIGMIGQTLSTITGIMQTVNTLESIAVGLKQEEATAAGVAAAGEAATSASKIPYVGWAIAIGAIAAIIGALSTAKSSVHFAQGGIVPGSSYSGDNILAGLNSGEMILNKGQQGRLFNILDGKAAFGGGKVEFVIKGQELKGVLNNYDKKMSRL